MAYPFVQAFHDLGPASGPRLAFVVHMAEGGGTVAFLSKTNTHGVSVHYVIEYSGRIVQMLREDHMHSSLRTSAIRTSNGPAPYGRTPALAVMGAWADIAHGTLGPNHASIAVEVEGFAESGPNTAQDAALVRLAADLRSRHPAIRNLGHRDFADYKACPGAHIDWAAIGGHGPVVEESMRSFTFDQSIRLGNLTVAGNGHYYLRLANDTMGGPINPATFGTRRAFGPVTLTTPLGPGDPRRVGYIVGTEAAFLLAEDVKFIPDGPPVVDCTDVVTAELVRAADRAALAVRTR